MEAVLFEKWLSSLLQQFLHFYIIVYWILEICVTGDRNLFLQ